MKQGGIRKGLILSSQRCRRHNHSDTPFGGVPNPNTIPPTPIPTYPVLSSSGRVPSTPVRSCRLSNRIELMFAGPGRDRSLVSALRLATRRIISNGAMTYPSDHRDQTTSQNLGVGEESRQNSPEPGGRLCKILPQRDCLLSTSRDTANSRWSR